MFQHFTLESFLAMTVQLVAGAVLGGVVGYERELHERPAGLRTHALVCMGSTLITIISLQLGLIGDDPGRVAAQIVSGIGFLGAGTILRQGNIVRGLTTAASLWTVAGIGMAVGLGGAGMLLAAVATGIVFITLSQMRRIESALGRKRDHMVMLQISPGKTALIEKVIATFAGLGVSVDSVGSRRTEEGKLAYTLHITSPDARKLGAIAARLSEEEEIDSFEVV
ncbi:MAG: MgtC/SapB family protein [Armatimonadota bacterium]